MIDVIMTRAYLGTYTIFSLYRCDMVGSKDMEHALKSPSKPQALD